MCGIVGIITKHNNGFSLKQETVFLEMLYCDALRGFDSTGVIGVMRSGTFHIAKEATDAAGFIPKWKMTKEATAVYNNGKVYIGHNRKKTVGEITDDQAHPFVVDDTWAMVHNGTLKNHKKIADTKVDSEALAIGMKKAIEGAESKEEVEKLLGEVDGAYAIVGYDQIKHRVILLRNKERPLHIIDTPDSWVFTSEGLLAQWILVRNGYKFDELKSVPVPEHEAFIWDLGSEWNGITKLVRQPLEVKKSSSHNNNTPAWGGTEQHGDGSKNVGVNDIPIKAKGGRELTAKEFRAFKKAWIGKRIRFTCDDFLEENYPKKVEDGETEIQLFGAHEDILVAHTIQVSVDLKEHPEVKRTSEAIIEQAWTIFIEDMDFRGGVVTMYGGQPRPIKRSKDVIQFEVVKESKKYREKLRFATRDELNTLLEEGKYSQKQWQYGAIKAELAFRDGINTVEDAIERAKNDSVFLKQNQLDGKCVYTDDEGRIYYESSVVIH